MLFFCSFLIATIQFKHSVWNLVTNSQMVPNPVTKHLTLESKESPGERNVKVVFMTNIFLYLPGESIKTMGV